jgi:hypothetical protein
MKNRNAFACLLLSGEALGLQPPIGFLREFVVQKLNIQNKIYNLSQHDIWGYISSDSHPDDDPLWCALQLYRGTILEAILNGTLTNSDRDWKPFLEDLARTAYRFAGDDVAVGLGFDVEAADVLYKQLDK